MKKIIIFALCIITFACSSNDDGGKTLCRDLNIIDQSDRTCEEYAQDLDCRCDENDI